MNSFLDNVNQNKYIWGITMVLMNIGARYIQYDVPKVFEFIFSRPLVRRIFVFCVCFMATRDITISLILTGAFIILFMFVLNPESDFCVIPKWVLDTEKEEREQTGGGTLSKLEQTTKTLLQEIEQLKEQQLRNSAHST